MLRITTTDGLVITIEGCQSDICTGKIEIENARKITVVNDNGKPTDPELLNIENLPS